MTPPVLINPSRYASGGGLSAYAAAVLADSPYVYYPLDETSGTTMTDLSGGARHGTYTNGPTLNQSPGISTGKSVNFVRQSSAQYGEAPAGTGGIFNSTAMTIECWFKTSNVIRASEQKCLVGRIAAIFGFEGWELAIGSDGKLSFLFTASGGSVIGSFPKTPSAVDDNSWHYCAATYSDASDTIKLYLDDPASGPVATATATNASRSNNDTLHIGMDRTGSGGAPFARYDGNLDEVAYYKAELAQANLAAHYAAR